MKSQENSFTAYVHKWNSIQAQIKELKEKEITMRKAIFDHVFKFPEEGANKAHIDDLELKATVPYNYALDADVHSQEFSKMLDDHSIDHEKLIKTKASISKSHYKKLSASQQEAIADYVTIKPGLPSLEIVNSGAD